MKYIKAPFKYQLIEEVTFKLKYIRPRKDIETWYCKFTTDGLLTAKTGWAWDGCSGPTWDTKNTRRAGCVHDLLAKLMRGGLLPQSDWMVSEYEFNKLLKDDGMWKFRRNYWIRGLRLAKGSYADPKKKLKVHEVPNVWEPRGDNDG